jgi:hypothetical protein
MRYDAEKLLFRRQFVLGPRFVEERTAWQRLRVRDTLYLTVHPDLNTCQVADGARSVTLLGYVLDPDHPQADDRDILHGLLRELDAQGGLDHLIERTFTLGGRWILIVDDGSAVRLLNDPMGLRQVFYTNDLVDDLWCASQPGILAEILKLEMAEDAVNEFIHSDVYRNWNEVLWPGDRSPYREIAHLLPNQYLDLRAGSRRRYWPDRDLGRLSLEEGAEKNSELLRRLIESASNRFDLAFTVTAGWDSRLLLAASRQISHKVYYFSLLRRENDPDVVVPSRLLPKLGLRHHVVEYPSRMDDEFERIYRRNVTEAHSFWGTMAQGLFRHYPQDRVCVKGNASEIARVRFRAPAGEAVTAERLAMFSSFTFSREMCENPYVVRAWQQWLSELGNTHNVHILDLFYWDHWAGNFAGMAQAEWDIVQEVFTPYNCRSLLMNMLSVDEQYRDHDEPILYKEMVKKLWPEVLSEPVNPPRRRSVKERVRRAARQVRRWGRAVAGKAGSAA